MSPHIPIQFEKQTPAAATLKTAMLVSFPFETYVTYAPSFSHEGAKESRAATAGMKAPKTHKHIIDNVEMIISLFFFYLIDS